jgi:transcriptional regulator with XRE-family HTH domain
MTRLIRASLKDWSTGMITPTQLRMARAALDLTTRDFGEHTGVSAMAISRYENGDTGVMSVETVRRLEDYCRDHHIFFGPKDGVCVGENVFATERWLGLACYQLLQEHGIQPSSRELLDAYTRSQGGPHA